MVELHPLPCKACSTNCKTCSDASTCTVCQNSKYLKDSACVDGGACGAGMFEHGSGTKGRQCKASKQWFDFPAVHAYLSYPRLHVRWCYVGHHSIIYCLLVLGLVDVRCGTCELWMVDVDSNISNGALLVGLALVRSPIVSCQGPTWALWPHGCRDGCGRWALYLATYQ